MRILLILRLYTGFDAALRERHLNFSGTTAVAKLIMGLTEADHTVRIVFARRVGPLSWKERRDVDLTIPGLPAQITVLAGEDRLMAFPPVLRRRLAYWRHLWPMSRIAREFAPDLIYIDRGHLHAAAFFARLTRIPVVWRVLGVPDSLRKMLSWRGPRAWAWHWLLRSPFAAVICSIDGSGGRRWLDRALRAGVPQYHLFAGKPELADRGSPLPALPPAATRVVFVGRLERLKGCEEFIASFLRAARQADGLHGVVVGTGSLQAKLVDQVASSGFSDRVTFTGAVDHPTVLAILKHSDIYVSLNTVGNLSNANLEALTTGVCMILPQSDAVTGVDLDTDEVLPADVAYRFGKVEQTDKLADAIVHFHRHPEERRARADAAGAWAEKHLTPWDRRIAAEIQLLESLAAARRNRRARTK
jgi:glycosyltransferase involved in cell wall biosynthesis